MYDGLDVGNTLDAYDNNENDNDVTEDSNENADLDDEAARPRIIMRIRRSLLGKNSKPPKKVARRAGGRSASAKCYECREGVSELDVKANNMLVDCGTHKAHKYCQADCLDSH